MYFSPVRATCLADVILIDLMALIIFGKNINNEIPHYPITSSLSGPTILLTILVLRYSVNVGDSYRTTRGAYR